MYIFFPTLAFKHTNEIDTCSKRKIGEAIKTFQLKEMKKKKKKKTKKKIQSKMNRTITNCIQL